MKAKVKRIFTAYGELLGEICKKAPVMVALTFAAAAAAGIVTPLSVFVNSHIFNDGIEVAHGRMTFMQYTPYLVLFVMLAVLPPLLRDIFIFGYVESKSQLILRTALKGRMLQKIKKIKYEHFESRESVEIIQKAYRRTENAARHMFPMYIYLFVANVTASAGLLLLLFQIKWWLLLTVLLPFALQTYFASRNNFNIYAELEKYWEKEQFYEKLSEFLKTKEYLKENKLNGASDYLIETYRSRMNSRNRDVLSTVTQEPARYMTFTVADNVFMGDTAKERDEAAVEKALRFSGLEEAAPDALLGKDIGGTDLSGGQWQKIAIARSHYRGRDFIILDEPTGNLDPIAEAEVFRKYLELARDKTVVFVTHRISVAALAERIVVFSHGNVVEDGTHETLMEQNGEYARLYNAQAKWYDR